MENQRAFAKKVFFLYPHSVFQEQLLTILVQAEFEVAVIDDHQKALQVLYRFPNSIIYINIESPVLKPKEWESFIAMIIQTKDRHRALVGIMTYNPTRADAEKYLMDMGVQCGFVGLKIGVGETAKILLKTLDANEAKGGRRYVRVRCNPTMTSVNIVHSGSFTSGTLLDISSAGCSCSLATRYPPGAELDDIQLKLWGPLVKVRGRVMGTRTIDDDHEVHVILFDENLDRAIVARIYNFIQKSVQAEVDAV